MIKGVSQVGPIVEDRGIIDTTYHIEPEGATFRYIYAGPSAIFLEFAGKRSSIRSARKRLNNLIEKSETDSRVPFKSLF